MQKKWIFQQLCWHVTPHTSPQNTLMHIFRRKFRKWSPMSKFNYNCGWQFTFLIVKLLVRSYNRVICQHFLLYSGIAETARRRGGTGPGYGDTDLGCSMVWFQHIVGHNYHFFPKCLHTVHFDLQFCQLILLGQSRSLLVLLVSCLSWINIRLSWMVVFIQTFEEKGN